MKAIVICGGTPPSPKILQEEVMDSDLIIAVDGGGNVLYKNNITPDYLIGDFDSITSEALKFFKNNTCNIMKYPKEKDATDSRIALDMLIEKKCTSITFLGCTGTRLDHFLGNLGLLKSCIDANIEGIILDDNNKIFITKKPMRLKGTPGTYISFQAYCNEVKNFSIQGAKYELKNYNLTLGDSFTISNEFIDKDIYIQFDNGYVVVLYSRD